MITCISNNFGVNPASIQLKDYQAQNIVVLQGMFTVDTTDADYQAASVLRITVPELSISKSHVTHVFVVNRKDGAHDITLTKAWVEKVNQICVMPLMEWDSLGSYEIFFASAFIPANKVASMEYANYMDYFVGCGKGTITAAHLYFWESTGWREIYFSGTSLGWDEDTDTIECSMGNCSDVDADFLPLIYTNDINREMGSQFFPCTLHNGNMTVSHDGITDDTGENRKFIKLFLVK